MASRTVSVREVFDTTPFTSYQIGICSLCFLVVFLDGFDLTMIGVALPKIAETLKTSPAALGLAVSAGLVGPLVGAIILGMLADRWGRKLMLLISALIFGVFTLVTAWITSVEQLALFRFLAGVGLGGAIPNALAFGCEYAPSRMRATLTTTMWAGMAVGALIMGLSAAYLIPHYGWQSLFIVGGIAPLVIGLLVMLFLPESLEFLVRQGKDKERIHKIISRISPTLARDPDAEFYSTEQKLPGVPVKHLFLEGRALTTLLLWVAFFGSFYLIWILLAWAPTFLRESGATVQQYSFAFACINFGSALAIITIGRLMDKFNPFVTLTLAFILAFFSFLVFGHFAGSSFPVIVIVSVVCGFFIFGANAGTVALGTISYPLDIRGSGVGWAYAIGKIGSMVAPVLGGLCLSLKWSPGRICGVNGLVALIVMVAILVLWKHVASTRRSEALKGAGSDTPVA
ncbi:MAG: MFS transporter [Desulfomonilaceae bacterium]